MFVAFDTPPLGAGFFICERHRPKWHTHGAVLTADFLAVQLPEVGPPRPAFRLISTALRATHGRLSLSDRHLVRSNSRRARHGRRWLFDFPRSQSVEIVYSAPGSVRGGPGKARCRVPMRDFPLDISSSPVQFGLSAKRYLETRQSALSIKGPRGANTPRRCPLVRPALLACTSKNLHARIKESIRSRS